MAHVLYIGNKTLSSWSLRPWLVLRWGGIPFEERLIRLDQPGYGHQEIAEVKAVAPTGTVPALHTNGTVIWDSLAIAEWAAEQVAPGTLWPEDPVLRAQARSATCEMHAGFTAVRRDLSMNLALRLPAPPSWADDTRRGLARIDALWCELRERHGAHGPWLFGRRSIADAFFVPVATRLRSYAVASTGVAAEYRETLLSDPDFLAWEADSVHERPARHTAH